MESKNEFKALRSGTTGKAAKELLATPGASVSGYVVKVATTPNKLYPTNPNKTIFLKSENGADVVIYADGNLRYLQEDMEKGGYEMGSFVRITRAEVPKKLKYKTFYDIAIKEGDVLDLSGGPSENPETQEY